MLTTKKPISEQAIRQIVPYFKYIHPNMLTVLSLLPALLFFASILTNHFVWALIFLLGSSLDLLDGAVARAFRKTSVFGEVLDSTVDRITDFLYITAFGFANIIPWNIVLSFLLLSFLISYIRSRGELALNKTFSLAIGFMERPERLIGIFIAIVLFLFLPKIHFFSLNILSFCFLLMSFLSLITTIQRLLFIKKI